MNLQHREDYFNPRSLHGERQTLPPMLREALEISIHAPCTGSDACSLRVITARFISIHAPCTGSDRPLRWRWASAPYFNPRSLHGERPGRTAPTKMQSHFNPRSLHGERHHNCGSAETERKISIHAPCTGSDKRRDCGDGRGRYFNPRSLHGERLVVPAPLK